MHRFNYMVKRADKIFVFKDGEIAELGTHDQLLEKKGVYYELFCAHKEINES